MIRKIPFFLCASAVLSLSTAEAQFSFGDLFNKKSEERVGAEEYATQQGTAQSKLDKAMSYENSGKSKQARDAYRSIVKSYPRTDAAAEAQFRYANMLDVTGDSRKAFEAYQDLITKFRNTNHFNESVQRQFEIAENMRSNERKGFLGIGASIQPSKLIEMFDQVASSVPQSELAPKSMLNIAEIHLEQEDRLSAESFYQKVVNTYPSTSYATEAQYEIFKIRGVTAENSNSPNEDRAQREAGLDFVNSNPNDQRAAEIRSGLDDIEARSMEKLFNTGRFYEKSGKPESARVYYREVVKNPNTPWAAKAQERLNALDNAPVSVEKKASFFGANPLKKESVEMRTSDDEVLPLPAAEADS
ncbi:MAG: tetratricopeptide repeat protein [Verrucomicrobiales bacterium]|nr:tetratricopeptide repeat protein [Verrucomicrobiales bacterium]